MILHIFLDVIIFIITLGILILVHEYGHFLAARILKIRIEQFSVGFGPVLYSWTGATGTKYIISVFLIGGYVKLLNKKTEKINLNYRKNELFHNKCILARSIVVLAGPMFNFIFSMLLYTIILFVGTSIYKPIINYILPNSIIDQSNIPIGSEIKCINSVKVNNWEGVRLNMLCNLNQKVIVIMTNLANNEKDLKKYVIELPCNWFNQSIINTIDPIIALGIFPNVVYVKSILMEKECLFFDKQNDLQIGDKILLINSKPIYDWESFVRMISNDLETKFDMVIERNKNLLYLTCYVYQENYIFSKNRYKNTNLFLDTLVIKTVQESEIYKYKLFIAMEKAFNKTWGLICFTIKILTQLFLGNINITNLHGPVAIAKGAGQSIRLGLIYYLMFLAIISINLGIINLLPILPLDGGQLFFLLLEKIKGNSISQKTQNFVYIISSIILIFIALLALYNDIITW